MKNKYLEIVKYIPSLEDHGHLYMYYGIPYSEECHVYGDDEEGENLNLMEGKKLSVVIMNIAKSIESYTAVKKYYFIYEYILK